ncbi:MAG: HAMP domain-containing histidine kinase [Desulfobacterales bacterium]|nr:MAG: HAMP domain-containing histidine kinase [Desulfobacterales bacterium]
MNKETQHQEESHQVIETPENFFRDVEIEFLIHELKDPMSIIETGLRTLLERQDKYGSLTSRQQKTLKRTLRNSKKARQMLNNLLEIGRSEAGCFICCRFQPAESAYQALKDSLETVAGSIFEEFRNCDSEGEAKEFLFKSGIVLDVDPKAAKTEMFQDEVKFRQIIGNLIKNALHHRQRRIEIKMELDNDQLVTEVIDDGPGIDPEHHDLIFKRYAQVKECSIIPRKGHGLGLAGALILARCLRGNIQINSEKGQGATFRLTLPLSLDSVQK